MLQNLNKIEPTTHLLTLSIIIVVAFFISLVFVGCTLYKKSIEEEGELTQIPDPELGEIDPTYYPETGEDLYR